jgi:hypothetical protein
MPPTVPINHYGGSLSASKAEAFEAVRVSASRDVT